MIKHSFVRSSKVPRVAFPCSVQQSPSKALNTEQPQPRRRKSSDMNGTIRSKEGAKNNRQNLKDNGFLKYLMDESMEQSRVQLQQMGSKQNQINALKNELALLQNKFSAAKLLEERCQNVEQRVLDSRSRKSMPTQQELLNNHLEQDNRPTIQTNGNHHIFTLADSRSQQSSDINGDTIALRQISKGMYVMKDTGVTRQYVEEYVNSRLQPLSKVGEIEFSLETLTKEVKEIKEREVHFLQILEKYNQQHERQLAGVKSSIINELQQRIKYEITRNNQIFFKSKSNDKELMEFVNRKLGDHGQRAKGEIEALDKVVLEIKMEMEQRILSVERQIEALQEDVGSVIENALEEFSNNVDLIRSEEAQLASISQSLMDIIKCLVKRTAQGKDQPKSLDLVDILKSNIIDINTIKLEQTALNRQLLSLKPREGTNARGREGGVRLQSECRVSTSQSWQVEAEGRAQ